MTPPPMLGRWMAVQLPLLGLLMTMAMARLARFPTLAGQGANLLLLLVILVACFCAALFVARRLCRSDAADGRGIAGVVLSFPVLLTVGILMRLPLLAAPPQLSDDIYRYAWDGRVAVAGTNPYRYAPPDPALSGLRDADWRRINNPTLPTIYPPVAQRLFEVATRIAPGVTGLKCLFFLFDLSVALLLSITVARSFASRWRLLVWWWHPLAVIEWSGSGHVDVAGIALLAAALALAAAPAGYARWLVTGLLVGLATQVKFLALLALPFVPGAASRKSGGWVAAGFVLALLVGYLPFMAPGVNVFGSLETYAARWRASDFFFGLMIRSGTAQDQPARLTDAKLFVALLAGAIATGVALLRTRPAAAVATTIGAAVVLSPTVHPWYLAWVLPFVAAEFSIPWIYATLAALLAYQAVPAWLAGHVWSESAWQKGALVLPFLALAVWELARWRAGRQEMAQ
ncbi:MAG TPA: hypothetical protein VF720_04885 [Candidatus Eisenbacteria bacterium]